MKNRRCVPALALRIADDSSYPTIPLSNEEIDAIRRPEIKAMEEELMVKSTIIFKNDGILPLTAEAKVYVDFNGGTADKIKDAVAQKAAVVDELEDATVAVFHITSFNDAYELMIEDAQDAKVPVVVVFEGTNTSEPALQQPRPTLGSPGPSGRTIPAAKAERYESGTAGNGQKIGG